MNKDDNLSFETIERLTRYLAEMQSLTDEEPFNGTSDEDIQLRLFSDDHHEWERRVKQLTDEYHDDIIRATLHYVKTQQPQEPWFSIEKAIRSVVDYETIKKVLPNLQSVIPEKHLIPNNKLANSLTKDIIDAGDVDLIVSGQGKNEIKTRCVLIYEGEKVKLSSRQPFTEYDRNVADAVTSLYEYGDKSHIITPAMVYRAMVHATETETPSQQQIASVTRSLDKMRFVRVQVDCSEELISRKMSLNGAQITGGKIDTYLLALDKVEVIAGGKKATAYKIIKPPILYDYARITGQVITVPASLLDVRDRSGGKIANTESRIAIKGYLMRRVSVMKGKTGNRQSKSILYDSIYSILDNKDISRAEEKRIRDYALEVLEYWKQGGFIKGYTETTKGKKKVGIDISL